MSDKLRAAAQAIVDRWDTPFWKDAPYTGEYINALRAALAEPETELVYAFRRKGVSDVFVTCSKARHDELSSNPRLFETAIFYAAPRRKWVSLTRDEVADIALDCYAANGGRFDDFALAAAIESALKDKNHEA